MRTYEYRCEECQHEFTVKKEINDDTLPSCPVCESKRTKKIIRAVPVTFKGNGFYSTDSRKGS